MNHIDNNNTENTLETTTEIRPFKQALYLFAYWMRFYCFYLFFAWVLYILREFELCSPNQESRIKFFSYSVIFVASGYRYLNRIDIKLYKELKKRFFPPLITLCIAFFLFGLCIVFQFLSYRILEYCWDDFALKLQNDVQWQKTYMRPFYEGLSFAGLIFYAVANTLSVALGEELFFRGILQAIFLKKFNNALLAIVFTALLFSSVHGMYYGGIGIFYDGILWGSLYYVTGSLFLPILFHFLHNISIILARSYLERGDLPDHAQQLVTQGLSMPICIIGLVLCICLFYYCLKILRNYQKHGKYIYIAYKKL